MVQEGDGYSKLSTTKGTVGESKTWNSVRKGNCRISSARIEAERVRGADVSELGRRGSMARMELIFSSFCASRRSMLWHNSQISLFSSSLMPRISLRRKWNSMPPSSPVVVDRSVYKPRSAQELEGECVGDESGEGGLEMAPGQACDTNKCAHRTTAYQNHCRHKIPTHTCNGHRGQPFSSPWLASLFPTFFFLVVSGEWASVRMGKCFGGRPLFLGSTS